MNIQSNASLLLYRVSSSAPAPKNRGAGAAKTAEPESTASTEVSISQAAKDKASASSSGVTRSDGWTRFIDWALKSARDDPGLGQKIAEQYASDTSYEIHGALVSLGATPNDPNHYAFTGELVTDQNMAAFKQEAAQATAGRMAIYQSEQAKGTSPAGILQKLFAYTDQQPADYLAKLGWTANDSPAAGGA